MTKKETCGDGRRRVAAGVDAPHWRPSTAACSFHTQLESVHGQLQQLRNGVICHRHSIVPWLSVPCSLGHQPEQPIGNALCFTRRSRVEVGQVSRKFLIGCVCKNLPQYTAASLSRRRRDESSQRFIHHLIFSLGTTVFHPAASKLRKITVLTIDQ